MTGTYYGNTAGSTLMNPPIVIAQSVMGDIGNAPFAQGGKLWFYQSTNYSTDLENDGTELITDGRELGMSRGDVIMSVVFTSTSDILPILALDVVTQVSSAGILTSSDASITSTKA